jgi:transposase-like protein
MNNQATPRVITLDAYAASHRAITELKAAGSMPHRVRIRSNKYLNNVVEMVQSQMTNSAGCAERSYA